MNTMPSTLAVISAEWSLSIGSKKWDCSAPPMSPRMLKPIPAVANARTLTRKGFDLLYSACRSALVEELMEIGGRRLSKIRNFDDLAPAHGRFVRADAHHRPVHRLIDIRERRPAFEHAHHKFMRQVRVGTTVAAALNEGEMLMLLGVINALRREAADRFGQQLRVIGHLDFLDLLPADVQHRFVTFDHFPLKQILLPIPIQTL